MRPLLSRPVPVLLVHSSPSAASCTECRRSVAAEPTPFCALCDERLIAATIADDEPEGWTEAEPDAAPVHPCRNCGRSADGVLCGDCDADYAAYCDAHHADEALSDALALDSFERRGSW